MSEPCRHPRKLLVGAVVGLLAFTASCADDSPSSPLPGGTVPPSGTVRAPNGTNMGAPAPNAGTAP
jgi:hypothetical protein